MKLETYLRMAEIPYQVDFEEPLGPKGKSPWISLNGEEIGDSQLIIEMLGAKYGKDFSSHLSTEQLAIARSMRIMIEDHFLWCLAVWRFDIDAGQAFLNSIEAPYILRFVMTLFRRRIVGASRVQGMGRHSHEEVMEMGRKDLKALSLCLGVKPFLTGDRPAEVDCALFGFLAQVVWNSAGSPYLQMLESECTNLQAYCHRIKERFWPDWGQCLNPPQSEIIQ
ncbi:failed axon connections homolog [Penaeus monodon]|uniref:failed axon connections homolog n=1 Tax=Penaeus monodon TaxID=6687 RepID=UPI0018A72165|nr:failed axon connections homolog [Penaeus monodon]